MLCNTGVEEEHFIFFFLQKRENNFCHLFSCHLSNQRLSIATWESVPSYNLSGAIAMFRSKRKYQPDELGKKLSCAQTEVIAKVIIWPPLYYVAFPMVGTRSRHEDLAMFFFPVTQVQGYVSATSQSCTCLYVLIVSCDSENVIGNMIAYHFQLFLSGVVFLPLH